MINTSSVRLNNKDNFKKCVKLRKQGLSYSEIRQIVPVAKSTLQNWISLAGLTLTKEHLEIQLRKRIENRRLGTEAARVTRENKLQEQINSFLGKYKHELLDTMLIGGCLLYEAEGNKHGGCRFSNSDHRLINYFIKFIEKYFDRNLENGFVFRLYVHKNREKDLNRILNYWSYKISIPKESIYVSWKNNIAKFRTNKDYFGQMSVMVRRSNSINRQIRVYCNIILGS